MQSQYGERLRTLKKHKSATKNSLLCFLQIGCNRSWNGCNGLEAFRVQSVDTFPGTVELEPAKIQIPRLPYKHYDEKSEFHLDPLQQFLGTLQTDPTQIHSNPITTAPP